MDAGEEPGDSEVAASIARNANAVIHEMAESLDALVPSSQPVGFLCECGCLAIVERSVNEYDTAGGAWLEGHKPA